MYINRAQYKMMLKQLNGDEIMIKEWFDRNAKDYPNHDWIVKV